MYDSNFLTDAFHFTAAKTFFQDQDIYFFGPRDASRPTSWSRRKLHHCFTMLRWLFSTKHGRLWSVVKQRSLVVCHIARCTEWHLVSRG